MGGCQLFTFIGNGSRVLHSHPLAIRRVQDEWGIFWNLLEELVEGSIYVTILPSTEVNMFSMFIEHALDDIVEGCLICLDLQWWILHNLFVS